MKKIGLFGGSFDPPHIGHFITAQDALTELKLDEVWFLVSFNPPHKKTYASFEQRAKMVELGIKGMPQFKVSIYEKSFALNKSYTSVVLKKIKAKEYDKELYFIMGKDQYAFLEKWHNPEELFNYANICILERKINPFRKGYRFSTLSNRVDRIKSPFQKKVIFLKNRIVEVEGVEIRERLKKNLPFHYLVPERVYKYITERKLYIK